MLSREDWELPEHGLMVAAPGALLALHKKKQQVDRRVGCSGLVDCGLLGVSSGSGPQPDPGAPQSRGGLMPGFARRGRNPSIGGWDGLSSGSPIKLDSCLGFNITL